MLARTHGLACHRDGETEDDAERAVLRFERGIDYMSGVLTRIVG